MKWSDVASISAVCGVLMLAGCSKEPSSESSAVAAAQGVPSPDADISDVLGDGDSIANAVECLDVGLRYAKESIEGVLQLPREPIAAKIPASELVYWGKSGPDVRYSPSRMSYCEAKLSKEQIDSFQGDSHRETAARLEATAELDKTALEEFKKNPFGAFNAVIQKRQTNSLTFEPSPKGDLEKSVEYAARIARERDAFDKANSGKKITQHEIEFVWMGIFGSPIIKAEGWNTQRDVYDPDTETLSITVVPTEIMGVDPETRESKSHYHFEIPVKMKLTPEQAQKLFQEYQGLTIQTLKPIVAMQLRKGVLTVREVSFKDYSTFGEDGFQRMGFRLDNIPVNVELSRNVLPEL